MHDTSIKIEKLQTKSFTNVNDVFSLNTFTDTYNLTSNQSNNITVYQAICDNSKMFSNIKEISLANEISYITSENYHALNRNSSDRCIMRSTSTVFYDLDTIAKRHSYHCVPEFSISNGKVLSDTITDFNKNGFGAKSIVQECATQIRPKLKMVDSLQITARKKKRDCHYESILSSEIFLKDDDYPNQKLNSLTEHEDRRQKFWSYAKYKTEYTNPSLDKNKHKKKDCGKRTEDPCPCQLFSYACPCTDEKSLTKLTKNSKSLTIADQFTSTTKLVTEEGLDHNQRNNKIKTSKGSCCEHKVTGTNVMGFAKKYEMTAVYEEPDTPLNNKRAIPNPVEEKHQSTTSSMKNSIKTGNKWQKKSKQIICPNCKEKLEIVSVTEDGDSINSKKSPLYGNNGISSGPEITNCKNDVDDTDVCIHNPPCELVPVCQILPKDNIYVSPKCLRRVSLTRHNPKMIKITKACRHHPPCTVVPSCQRINVLRNNCEYIPPCLHRPRCINVPLCVPFSKTINCDELVNKQVDDTDNTEGAHYRSCKYMPVFQQDSFNNYIDHEFHAEQNTCEYLSEYTPRFILNSKMPSRAPTYSPRQVPINLPCKCCQSNKSCQYDCLDCKCIPPSKVQQPLSSDAVVYIRDVGCQFRSKNFSPRDSLLHSKTSSASFDLTSTKAGNYYANYHTLRYEDKYTNPISGEDLSLSTFTTSSLEIDVHCPSHGRQTGRKRTTGFSPKSTIDPFVAAFSTYTDPILQQLPVCEKKRETSKSDSIDMRTYFDAFPGKSQKSSLKGKHTKVFSIKRRRKSR